MTNRTIIIQLSLISFVLFFLSGPAYAKTVEPVLDYYAEEKAKQGFDLATKLYDQQLDKEALTEAVKILSLYPTAAKVPDILFLIGTIHADISNPGNSPQLAIKTWQQLIDRYPQYPPSDRVIMQLAEKWESLQEWQQAVQAYDRIPVQYAKSIYVDDALFWSARAEAKLNRFAEAKKKWGIIINNYPDANDDFMKLYGDLCDDSLMLIAEVSIAQQDTTGATTAWEKVVAKYPDSPYWPVALYHLGKIYQETYYQPTVAITYYQKIIEYIPDSTWQRLAKLKLDQCRKGSGQ